MSGKVVAVSSRFGRIEVEASEVIEFSGLPGFPDANRFVVMEHSSDSLFAWLVSLDEPELAFVIANPWHFFPGYDPPIEAQDLSALGIEAPEELEVVAIAQLADGRMCLNLAAPLLINTRRRRGVQLIPEGSKYGSRVELPAPGHAPQPPPESVPRAKAARRRRSRRAGSAEAGQGARGLE